MAIWGSGDWVVGAVAVAERGVAADGDAGVMEAFDVGFVAAAVVIGELVRAGALRVAHRSDQEGGHLGSGDRVVGAVAVAERGVAADGDAGVMEAFDVGFVAAAVVIGELVRAGALRVAVGSDQEGGHLGLG